MFRNGRQILKWYKRREHNLLKFKYSTEATKESVTLPEYADVVIIGKFVRYHCTELIIQKN